MTRAMGKEWLIAATALADDRILLTRNTRHFQRIPNLKLYQPA